MRRGPLVIAFIVAALSLECSERLWLPASGFGGGIDNGGGRGSGDNQGSGGNGQGGGRNGQGQGGGGGRGGFVCQDQPIKLPLHKTRLVFSLGKNTSMSKSFGNNGGTRLSVVEQLLQSIIADNVDAINFGFQDFPGVGTCGGGAGCCAGAFIPPDSTTYNAIQESIQCGAAPLTKGCGTNVDARPVGPALQAASSLFSPTDGVEHDLVLIVDGDPSCASEDPNRSCDLAKTARAQLPATTIVVGVGQDAVSAGCLGALALQANRSLSVATDPGQLNKILNDVIRTAAAPSCVIYLKTPTDRSTVRLFIQGNGTPRDGPDGWDYAPGPELKMVVRGATCNLLQHTPEDQIQVLGCSP